MTVVTNWCIEKIMKFNKPKLKKGIYSHFKHPDKFYEVLTLARNTETEEWLVIYKPLYKSDFADLCARPYKMFFEKAKDSKTGKLMPRFKYIKVKK